MKITNNTKVHKKFRTAKGETLVRRGETRDVEGDLILLPGQREALEKEGVVFGAAEPKAPKAKVAEQKDASPADASVYLKG